MIFQRYEDIKVWQLGRDLVKNIYALTAQETFARDWRLRDQIQRAAISVCSNIAEGYARRGNMEFIKFLWIAKGSAAGVQPQLYHALDLGYITSDQFKGLYEVANAIQGGIFKLIQSLSQESSRQKL